MKAYGEFANENRPAGWNLWLTFNIFAGGANAAYTFEAHVHEIESSYN